MNHAVVQGESPPTGLFVSTEPSGAANRIFQGSGKTASVLNGDIKVSKAHVNNNDQTKSCVPLCLNSQKHVHVLLALETCRVE